MRKISDIKASRFHPESDDFAKQESQFWDDSHIDLKQLGVLQEQFVEAKINKYKQELSHAKEDQRTRQIILWWFMWTFSAVLGMAFLCLIFSGFQEEALFLGLLPPFNLSDQVLIALSAGIIAGMIGLIAIPMRYIFSHKKP